MMIIQHDLKHCDDFGTKTETIILLFEPYILAGMGLMMEMVLIL